MCAWVAKYWWAKATLVSTALFFVSTGLHADEGAESSSGDREKYLLIDHDSDVVVTLDDLAHYFSRFGSGATASIEKVPNIETAIGNTFVIKTLAARASAAQLIDASLQERIAEDGLNRKLMGVWLDQEVQQRLAQVDWAQIAYEEFLAKSATFKSGEEVRASHILFEVHEQRFAEVVAQAEVVRQLALNGESFDELARQYSESDGGANGGDLGYFSRGQMVREFEEVAFALKVGEISDLVQSPFGLHIIKVTGRKDSVPLKFEDVEAAILSGLRTSVRRKLREDILALEKSRLDSEAVVINEELIEHIRSGQIKLDELM